MTRDIPSDGHVRGPVTLTPVAERLAVELALPVLTTYICPDRASNPVSRMQANALPLHHHGGYSTPGNTCLWHLYIPVHTYGDLLVTPVHTCTHLWRYACDTCTYLYTPMEICLWHLYIPGSLVGNPHMGKATRKASRPLRRKPIHHAPTQRGLLGVRFSLPKTRGLLLYLLWTIVKLIHKPLVKESNLMWSIFFTPCIMKPGILLQQTSESYQRKRRALPICLHFVDIHVDIKECSPSQVTNGRSHDGKRIIDTCNRKSQGTVQRRTSLLNAQVHLAYTQSGGSHC